MHFPCFRKTCIPVSFFFHNLVQSNHNPFSQRIFPFFPSFSRTKIAVSLIVGKSLSSGLDILLRLILGGSVGNEALTG